MTYFLNATVTYFIGFMSLLCFVSTDSFAQSKVLWNGELVLVGPNNVSRHLPDQSLYYINKYSHALDLLEEEKRLLYHEIDSLQTSKKIFGKKKRYFLRKNLEKVVLEVKIEEKDVFAFMTLWDRHVIDKGNIDFAENYDPSKCYELITDPFVFAPSEYILLESLEDDSGSWREICPINKVALPNSIDEMLADRLIVKDNRSESHCPYHFEISEKGNYCTLMVNMNTIEHEQPHIYAQRNSNGGALNIVGYRVVKCQ